MSRIGNNPIAVPQGVDVKISTANEVTVKGPKGELKRSFDPDIKIEMKDGEILLHRPTEQKRHKSLHGTYRALINNMIVGVHDGFSKKLELVGVGYRASNQGQLLDLSIGFSHNYVIEIPSEVKVTTETVKGKNPIVTLESFDKEILGQVTAKIRSLRKPEPYQGKGIRFVGEQVRRKAGKTVAK